jgi:hypothetical protein
MEDKLNLFSFKGKYRILHLTWFAFFMTFVVWLSLGPMMPFIQEALSLCSAGLFGWKPFRYHANTHHETGANKA